MAEEATPPAAESAVVSPAAPAVPAAAAPAAAPATPAAPTEKTWRDFITDDGLKDHSKNFTDLNHVLRGHADLRKKLSSAINIPGKDAKPEDIAEFRAKLGVPETPDAYKFHTPEGHKPTEGELAVQKEWAKDFYDLNLSSEAALKLTEKFNQRAAAAQEAHINMLKENAAASVAALKQTWGSDFDKNMQLYQHGTTTLFGKNLDAARQLLGQDGKPVLDNPLFIEAMAAYGAEAPSAGGPGLKGSMSESDRTSMNDQFQELTAKMHNARARNDHILLRQLAAKRDAISEKLHPGTTADNRAA